jgi:hypothetical protein
MAQKPIILTGCPNRLFTSSSKLEGYEICHSSGESYRALLGAWQPRMAENPPSPIISFLRMAPLHLKSLNPVNAISFLDGHLKMRYFKFQIAMFDDR